MIIYHDINEVNISSPVVTIGFFDGVHLGHCAIIDAVKRQANAHNRQSLLITFWPHPRKVLHNDDQKLKLLSTLEEKQQLLFAKGIDAVLVIEFTTEFAKTPAIAFIEDYLVKNLRPSAIVLGYNHAFGYKGQGNYNLLKQHENHFGYHATQVAPVSIDGVNISSTKIREALDLGNLEHANAMLGRHYSITGTIEGGQQVGRAIGFPTANISPSETFKQVPANGVYAVWVHYEGTSYPAMLNIGIRPTLGDGLERTIEAHIIGFSKNIYNEEITVRFVEKIRDEQKFDSLESLKEQLKADKENAVKLLNAHSNAS
ncbi:bifunctional riboflavin kinase/FAD synthetase [Perlabentimonas gracilis]|uniref:bifunctional riboflavin kinase/FAD synthetase n=1 Tax=Perlabentimonas gracilis TaxID=2715279 RepID=UPI001409EB54|nr:bifunctional riboflavin kinase/FAD synthetase [Perlabentimonas gracilis]NHB67881.1 bifunctional riboflavin kinase/FAD synthetase [Perlabentimonas gracilis]